MSLALACKGLCLFGGGVASPMRQACQKAGRGITARASSEPVAAGEAHDFSPWPAGKNADHPKRV